MGGAMQGGLDYVFIVMKRFLDFSLRHLFPTLKFGNTCELSQVTEGKNESDGVTPSFMAAGIVCLLFALRLEASA